MATLTKADKEREIPDKKWSDDKIIAYLKQVRGMSEDRAYSFLRGMEASISIATFGSLFFWREL